MTPASVARICHRVAGAAALRVAASWAAAVAAAAAPPGAAAQDLAAGRAKAQMCAVCHGMLGIATLPGAPHLAGMPAPYLVAQLHAYRSGARKHEVMSVVAKPLSDDDIAALAAWFSAIRIEATAP